MFSNTYIKDCWTNPWEIATCFMSPGYEMIHTASATDFLGIVSVILNNCEFQQHIHINLGDVNNIFSQSRDVRNSIMHTSTFQITKKTLDQMCETIIKMLESLVPVHLQGATDTVQQRLKSQVQRAVVKVKQIRDDKSPISTEDVTHVISQSEDARERMKKEVETTIAELKEALRQETEKRVQDIESVVTQGIVNIQRTGESSIMGIRDERTKSHEFIQEQLALAATELNLKKDEGLGAIDERTVESTQRLEDIVKREKEDLDNKVQQIKLERSESDSKGEELDKKVLQIDDKMEKSVLMLQNITQVCMQKICDVTASFNQTIEESNYSNEDKDEVEERLHTIEEGMELLQTTVTDIKEQIQEFVEKKKLYRCATLNIGQKSEGTYSISSIAKMDVDKLAVVDSKNETLLIFDLKKNDIINEINLLRPFDVSKIDENKCVVTCGYSLEIITLDPELVISKTIKVDAYSYGIVYNQETYIVSFLGPKPSIKILDLNGGVLKLFDESVNGQALFESPDYIAYNSENDIVYVSDRAKSRVVCINIVDETRKIYTNESLKLPSGIVVDGDKKVFVAGLGSHNIHYISPEGSALQILLERTREWKYPLALAFCDGENKLYMSEDSYKGRSGIIHVYQIV